MSFTTYSEAAGWITGLVPFGIRPGLKRMETMMERLGCPQRRLKFIHVAGTNGKGSTCAYLSQVLHQSGYSVGTFTSPYITKFTNRIQFNLHDIEEDEVVRISNVLKPIADDIASSELGSPTMFEITTALAVYYFAKVKYPDYVVWETGLGGRLDSTNIVVPIVSVITNIGHDHMDILGDTIEKIAIEKAGIIKSGIPVVSAIEQPEAVAAVQRIASEKKSTMYLLGEQFRFEPIFNGENKQDFHFEGPFRRIENISISLNGYHQLKNAAVALMTLEVLRQYYAALIDDEDIRDAMNQTAWPGRLELLSRNPRLLIDGAHNPEGAESLANALKQTYSYNKLHLLIGMLSTKNHRDYLRHILPLTNTLIVTEPDFRKKMDAESLAGIVDDIRNSEGIGQHTEVILEPDWKKALHRLTSIANQEDLAVVTGTLYLIADVRSWILNHSDSEKGW